MTFKLNVRLVTHSGNVTNAPFKAGNKPHPPIILVTLKVDIEPTQSFEPEKPFYHTNTVEFWLSGAG